MKKRIVLIGLIVLCSLAYAQHNNKQGQKAIRVTTEKQGQNLTKENHLSCSQYRTQCAATTKRGKQCQNLAKVGSLYCGVHGGW